MKLPKLTCGIKVDNDNDISKVKSGLIGQFSWMAVGNLTAALLRMLTLVLLVRRIPPGEFGIYAGLLGAVVVAQAVSDLGLAKLILRERSRSNASNSIYVTALWINRRVSIALGMVLALAILGASTVDATFLMLLPVAISASAEKTADTWMSVSLAAGKMSLNAANLVSRRLIALGLFLILSMGLGVHPLLAISSSEAIAGIFSVGFATWLVKADVAVDKKEPIVGVLRLARPFWINSLGMHLRNIDVALVSLIASPVQAGFYGSAARVIGPLQLLPASLATVLIPSAARRQGTKVEERVAAWTSAAFLVVCVGVALSADFWVPVLFGRNYELAVPAMQWVVLGLAFSVFANLFSAILQGYGHAQAVAKIAIVYAVLSLGLVSGGAALFGAAGAGGGLTISSAVHAFLICVAILRYRRMGGGGDASSNASANGSISAGL